jgi:hypothetical protein
MEAERKQRQKMKNSGYTIQALLLEGLLLRRSDSCLGETGAQAV